MPNRTSLLACALLLIASGCGTITNFSESRHPPGGPPQAKVFGGVREDLECATEAAGGEWPVAIIALLDAPLSLVGDVLTLPWSLKATRQRKTCPDPRPYWERLEVVPLP